MKSLVQNHPSRRAIVGAMGASLGLLALRGHAVLADAAAHFTHGVASGDPLADRVILWTRALPGTGRTEALSLTWQMATDASFSRIAAEGVAETGAARDYTVKVDAGGLEPGQTYYYRFTARGVESPVGRTRTLPAPGARHVRFAVVSCSNYPQGYFNAYKAIKGRTLDAVLHLGDYIYEYPEGTYANKIATDLGRHVKPAHEIVALEDYRMRYGLYRSDADLQAVHAAHPFICVWDDHEIANNTWKGGAENHNDGEGDFAARRAAAVQAYHEWLPIRENHAGEPEKIYRSFDYGGLASLIMLDTRVIGRDKQLDYASDLPMRTVGFDMTDPDAPVAVADGVTGDHIKQITVPFDLSGEKPEPMTDWATIKALDPKKLPKGFSYLPDADKFLNTMLRDETRTMMGMEQEAWLSAELAKSKAAGVPWQILGQQVLIGRVGMPTIDEKDIDFEKSPYLTREKFGFFRMLGAMGLPFNTDFWDGYPACRDRVYESIQANANNAVFLAGDTHNAWAFSLTDKNGNAVAVEFGTPGITSPGIETYLPVETGKAVRAFMAASPELVYLDAKNRGWLELDITPDQITSHWYFVTSVLDQTFDIIEGPRAGASAGDHMVKMLR